MDLSYATTSATSRAHLTHPVIDADGHWEDDFTPGEVWSETNPDFFKGTAVEKQATNYRNSLHAKED